ncbi:MAG: choice-of-anchor Q domain-containing protein [Candidatus Methylacidiphilales bacterium]
MLANPGGGTVVGGSATISSGPGQVTVNQTSNRAVVNWNSFTINKGETTTFVQPGSKSAVLNRVTGGTASQIDGSLKANGQVYLVNRNGVVIGKTGRVNTAGFTASTHDVANSEFMAGGDMTFRGSSGASVINHGKIRATDGDVTLIARQVENTGKITARKGSVNLAGGTEVLVKPSGNVAGQRVFIRSASGSGTVSNSGSIRATTAELHAAGGNEYALAINNTGVIRATGSRTEGGRVLLSSKGGRIVNGEGGTIRAVNNDGSGGEVRIAGGQIELKRNSTIDASARRSTGGRGGTILVGGDARGAGTMEQAWSVTVEAGAQLKADATPAAHSSPNFITSFDGGKVVVWSTGTTTFNGSISALGSESASGKGKGKGGWVETSGHDLAISRDAMVITGGGEWLLDPVNLTIVSTGGASGSVPAANGVTGADTSISSGVIVSALASGVVTLLATNSITLNADASFTFSSGFDLTLDTPTINLLGYITSTGGSELKGTATTVNVGAGGHVQNAVDVSSTTAPATISLAAATYRENVTIASKNLTINGAGKALTTVSGDIDTNGTGDGRVFDITGTGKTVTIANMTITQGVTTATEGGGGIRIGTSGNTVTIRNSNVINNASGSEGGGGIYNRGTLFIDNSSVSSNRAGGTSPVSGGGIAHLEGTITITGSQINDNNITTTSSAVNGGGLYSAASSTVNASNSEFQRNELSASANGFGGGIFAQLTFLTLNNVLVNGNSIAVDTGLSSARGGGIYIDRSIVSIDRTTVSGNTLTGAFTVMGGGIYLQNTIGGQSFSLTNSTISGNSATITGTGTASAYGGGFYITNDAGSIATITSSTFSANYVSSNHTSIGGGIMVNDSDSTLTITNVTMTGNEARTSPVAARGGAIHNVGILTILDSTIVNNGALASGGGIRSFASVTIRNSIVARNYQIGTPGWMDVAGTFNDLGNNLIGDVGTATGFTTSTLIGNAGSPIDPLVAPLGSYGGTTQTMALLNGSPALNAGSSASATDQRGAGYVRTAGSIDIGAYEAQAPGTSHFNASYLVTNTQDYGPTSAAISNSLRMALTFAEAPGTVLFAIPTSDSGYSGGVYTIRAAAGTTGFAAIGRSRIIDGTSQIGYASTPLIVLDGMDLGSTLSIDAGALNTVQLKALGITNGTAVSGGGVNITSGIVTISDSRIYANNATGGVSTAGGGGIYNAGTLTLNHTSVASNNVTASSVYAYGGGIYNNGGIVTIQNNSIITLNTTNSGFNFSHGGGIYTTGAQLIINGSEISGNQAISAAAYSTGGGISSLGTILSITNSVITGNTVRSATTSSTGGGIYLQASGTSTIQGSTISNNSAEAPGGFVYGGGIYTGVTGTLSISNSTLSGNTASGSVAPGGGIALFFGGTATLTNVTISGNTATRGGGIFNDGQITVTDATIANNSASLEGAGIYSSNTASVRNSIIARNYLTSTLARSDASGTFTDSGNNLIGDSMGSTGFTTSTLVGTGAAPIDPLLAPLGNYGGTTQTHALLNGSPALNAGSSVSATDQRGAGYVRTAGSVDIGAYDAQTPGSSPFNGSYVVTNTQDYGPTQAAIANSLRMALTFAEAPDIVLFNIPTSDSGYGGGVYTIRAAAGTTGFATSGRSRIIDGTSQTGYASTPLIVLDGMDLGSVLSLNPGAGRTVQLKALAITNGTAVNGGGLHIASGSVTIGDSLIYSNVATAGATAKGGAIYNRGTLLLDNTSVYLNEALSSTINAFGGAIYNQGVLTIRNGSVIRDNKAQATTGYAFGGAILNDGMGYTVSISDSTLQNNRAITGTNYASGGAIYNWMGTINLTNVLISANSTYVNGGNSLGGGIYSMEGILDIKNSTLTGNSATATAAFAFGGGIYNEGSSTVTISFSTITQNSVQAPSNAFGGGINRTAGSFTVQNSIIAGNYIVGTLARSDVRGIFVDGGFNLIGDGTGSTGFTTSTLVGTGVSPIDPLLAPLGNYGGLTQTYALLPGSPALNTANPSTPGKTRDQRGAAQYGGRWDIGAFESQGFTYTIDPATGGNNQTAMVGNAFSPLTVTISSNDGLTNFTGGKVTIAVPTASGAATATGTLTATVLSGTPTQAVFSLTAAVATGTYQVDVADSTLPLFFTLTNSGIPITLLANAGQGKVYGDADALPYGYSILVGPAVVLNGALSRQAGEDAGSYVFLLGSLAALNPIYAITLVAGPDYTIASRAITITANAAGKTYGDTDPSLTWSLTSGSYAAGDSAGSIFIGGLARTAGENVGLYGITQGTLAATANYQLTYQGNTLTITPRSITVTPDSGQSKLAGSSDPVLTYTINGSLAPWDNVSTVLSGSLSRTAGETVGAYPINLGTLANLNYLFTPGIINISFNILPSAIDPLVPVAPGTLLTPDIAAFNATLGRNNEDEKEYPKQLRRSGIHPHISYSQQPHPVHGIFHLSSFDVLSDGTQITQPR